MKSLNVEMGGSTPCAVSYTDRHKILMDYLRDFINTPDRRDYTLTWHQIERDTGVEMNSSGRAAVRYILNNNLNAEYYSIKDYGVQIQCADNVMAIMNGRVNRTVNSIRRGNMMVDRVRPVVEQLSDVDRDLFYRRAHVLNVLEGIITSVSFNKDKV